MLMDQAICSYWICTQHDVLSNIGSVASILTGVFSIVATIFAIVYFYVDRERYLSGRWEGTLDNVIDDKILNLDCILLFTKHKNQPVSGMLYYSCKAMDGNMREGLDELDRGHSIEKFDYGSMFQLKFIRKIHVSGNTISTDSETKYNWDVVVKKDGAVFYSNKKYTMYIKVSLENKNGISNKIYCEGIMYKIL